MIIRRSRRLCVELLIPFEKWFASLFAPRRRNGGLDGSDLGIDLQARAIEVARLFYAGGYAAKAKAMGVEPEELLQEVYKALEIRNHGVCPWDHRKSSFGHYVHLVMNGTAINQSKIHGRRRRGEVPLPSRADKEDGKPCREIAAPDAPDLAITLDRILQEAFDDGEREVVRSFLRILSVEKATLTEAAKRVGRDRLWGEAVRDSFRQIAASA
jgi:hypothetical protein